MKNPNDMSAHELAEAGFEFTEGISSAMMPRHNASEAVVAAFRAYDRALQRHGAAIDAGSAPVFIRGNDLDMLYAALQGAIDALAQGEETT